MKITKVTIKKFRSIENASFNLKKITGIVGENNSGKTAILRALNAVFNFKLEEKYFKEKTHRFAIRGNTYITVHLNNIPSKSIYKDKIDSGELKIKFMYDYSRSKEKYFILKGQKEEVMVNNDFIEKLSEDIKYVYISANRTIKDIAWSGESIFSNLIINHLMKETKKRDNISGNLRSATNKIHDNVLKKLEKQINKLYMQNKDMDFKIDFPNDIDYKVLLHEIKISLNEYDSNYSLKDWGSGTISLAIIAMHRANALLDNTNIILGIEEPEINLHPHAQKRFIMSLKENLLDVEIQTIFTTHSTVLIDELKHEDILLIRRSKDKKRGFISIVNQIPDDFLEKYELDDFKNYQFFRYKNSEFFFSKYVIVGESKNDCQVFKVLIENEIKNQMADISFLNLDGIKNLKYPYFLLKELKIPFVAVVDMDFFYEYLNDSLEASRNKKTGLPNYKKQIKENNLVIKKILCNKESLKVNKLKSGYRVFFNKMKEFSIIPMMYCLEMDLTNSKKARKELYKINNIRAEKNQNQKYLLIEYKKQIKKVETILDILNILEPKDYPESYSKIKNFIIKDIKKYK